MNARNCMTVTIVALATMGMVLATNWPNPLDAEDPAPVKAKAKVIKTPTLNVRGCTLSFIPRDKAAKAGDDYVVRLKAVNTTDKPVGSGSISKAPSESVRAPANTLVEGHEYSPTARMRWSGIGRPFSSTSVP